MNVDKTPGGYDCVYFLDRYDIKCSLQKSSINDPQCIWLGVNKTGRMHLSREQVAELLPYLQKFVDTGEIV
jgi:hypothetical protein